VVVHCWSRTQELQNKLVLCSITTLKTTIIPTPPQANKRVQLRVTSASPSDRHWILIRLHVRKIVVHGRQAMQTNATSSNSYQLQTIFHEWRIVMTEARLYDAAVNGPSFQNRCEKRAVDADQTLARSQVHLESVRRTLVVQSGCSIILGELPSQALDVSPMLTGPMCSHKCSSALVNLSGRDLQLAR